MKIIDNFSQRFLTYSRVTLFLLFALASFDWYDTNDPTKSYIASIVNWIGCISFAAWIYAIGHKANDKLKQYNIQLSVFRFFNLCFIIMFGCILSMYFLSKGNVNYSDTSGVVTYHVTYSQPGWIALIFVSALIFTLIIAAKTLVSAEQKKEVDFGDYLKTLLMFAFSWIGLWWIQPRVQKL
jgi:hypothetical protein